MSSDQPTTLARRRLALEKIDNAKFSWYHIRAIVVAGVGFYTDAYDIFAVNFANVMIGYVYFADTNNAIPSPSDTAIKISTSAGTVMGQLGFGFLADHLGRKKMYGIELMIIIFSTLALALSASGPGLDIVGVMIFWRVVLGTGVGGDYPLSSIITSEFATVKWRGAMMAAVFANQGFGQFTAALITFICTVGFKDSLDSKNCSFDCQLALDKSWRIVYGFGAVPACAALYFRLTIPETIRYTLDISQNEKIAAADAIKYVSGKYGSAKLGDVGYTADAQILVEQTANGPPQASFRDFIHHFGQWKNGKVLLGTAGSWFVLDVAFVLLTPTKLTSKYGLGLNTSIILSAINYAGGNTVYEKLYNNGVGNLILSVAGLIPGYWFSVATIDIIGRKPIQIGGFVILTILFCILGFGFDNISTGGKFALYCLCNFFQNFGPNTTTFIVPGEVFPTRYRSTAHGISAAAGKVGAIIAQALIGPLRNRGGTNAWLNHVMEIFAVFMYVPFLHLLSTRFAGIFLSFLIPETKRKTLEELTGEEHYYRDEPANENHSGTNSVEAEKVV